MKKVGYLIYAFWFFIFRIFPVKKKLVFMIATHDDSMDGNIGITAAALRKMGGFQICILTRSDGIHNPFRFFVKMPFCMARAEYIFLDNIFLPMAYLTFSKKAKIVQLWHGTGTVKKFGQDVNQGDLGRLEYLANQRITHLIVNSEYTKKQYAKAFGVNEDVVYILGLPRSDLFFRNELLEQKKERFYKAYPELKGKRLLLYAPTFRDDQVEHPQLGLDLETICESLTDEVLLLRLHPHVAANFSKDALKNAGEKVLDVSEWEEITTILVISNILITDYSSIIFEYCLLERPIIFYAYDLLKFEHDGRSFYEHYETYVPGDVVKTEKELLESISKGAGHSERAKKFKEDSFAFLDGRSTERLLRLILGNK